jgi:hypothetical protein
VPQNTILSIAGAIDTGDAERMLAPRSRAGRPRASRKRLADPLAGGADRPPARSPGVRAEHAHPRRARHQPRTPDHLPMLVANAVLGGCRRRACSTLREARAVSVNPRASS